MEKNNFFTLRVKFIPPLSFAQLDDIVATIRYYGMEELCTSNYTMYIFDDETSVKVIREEIEKDCGLSKDDQVLNKPNQVVRILANGDLVKIPAYFFIVGI